MIDMRHEAYYDAHMAVELDTIEQLIREHITGVEHVEIKDLTGSKDHLDATVVSSAFEGVSPVKQHQMVYKALGDLMAGPIHALALKTLTPDAWTKTQKKSLI